MYNTDKYGDLQVIYLKNNRYILPEIHPAVIMHTSGTEGYPKGVMLSEQNIYVNLKGIKDYFRIGADDCILITRPLIHCCSYDRRVFDIIDKWSQNSVLFF